MDPTQSPGSGRFLLATAGILLAIYAGYALAIANDNSPPPSKSEHSLLKTAMSGGGRPGAQEQYRSNGTLGQPLPVGSASTSDYQLQAGFWAGARLPFSDVPEARQSNLGQNFPNPFNPATSIPYFLAEDTQVDLAVYDTRGRRIRTLAQDFMPRGNHQVIWDGKDAFGQQAASGMYFFRLRTEKTNLVKKMILVK